MCNGKLVLWPSLNMTNRKLCHCKNVPLASFDRQWGLRLWDQLVHFSFPWSLSVHSCIEMSQIDTEKLPNCTFSCEEDAIGWHLVHPTWTEQLLPPSGSEFLCQENTNRRTKTGKQLWLYLCWDDWVSSVCN